MNPRTASTVSSLDGMMRALSSKPGSDDDDDNDDDEVAAKHGDVRAPASVAAAASAGAAAADVRTVRHVRAPAEVDAFQLPAIHRTLVRLSRDMEALYMFVCAVAAVETSNPHTHASMQQYDAERMRSLWNCREGSVEFQASADFAARHVRALHAAEEAMDAPAARAAATAALRTELPGALKYFVRPSIPIALQDVMLRVGRRGGAVAAVPLLDVLSHDALVQPLSVLVSLTLHMPTVPANTRGVSNVAFVIMSERYALNLSRLARARLRRNADGSEKWVVDA